MNIAVITSDVSLVGRAEELLNLGIISEERLQELVFRAEDLARIEASKYEDAEIVHLNILAYEENDEIGYSEEEIGGFDCDKYREYNWSCKQVLEFNNKRYAVEIIAAVSETIKN